MPQQSPNLIIIILFLLYIPVIAFHPMIVSQRHAQIAFHRIPKQSILYRNTRQSNYIRHYIARFSTKQQQEEEPFISTIRTNLLQTILPTFPNNLTEITFLLSISGGCDSTALFHSLHHLPSIPYRNKIIPCQIHVAHFDHLQRGENSTKDRFFVESLCREFDVPFHCFVWNNDNSSFSQEKARDWRKRELVSLVKHLVADRNSSHHCGYILTAHHADDSEETLLLKLLRGVHLSNINGIPSLTKTHHRHVYFVKPMLQLRKTTIQHFLTKEGYEWRDDESNISNNYLRNRVRNELVPLLIDLMGGEEQILQKRLFNLEEQSLLFKDDLTHRVREYISNKNITTQFPIPYRWNLLEREALFQWIHSRIMTDDQHTLSYDQLQTAIQQIRDYPHRNIWTLELGCGYRLKRYGAILEVIREQDDSQAVSTIEPSWSILPHAPPNPTHRQIQLSLKLPKEEKRRFVLQTLNNRKDVLFFQPSWRRSKIKLKDFLRGQKVPLHKRPHASILCFEDQKETNIVGVFVEKENGGKWMIGADFEDREENEGVKKNVWLERNA